MAQSHLLALRDFLVFSGMDGMETEERVQE